MNGLGIGVFCPSLDASVEVVVRGSMEERPEGLNKLLEDSSDGKFCAKRPVPGFGCTVLKSPPA